MTSEKEEKMPAISIIVPVYNKISSLRSCVESLDRQTISHGEMEVILVDDGSTDGSSELCDRLQRDYSFITVIHKENGGVSSARNAGMDGAKGRYIMFVDADDAISSSTAKALVDCFDSICDKVDVVTYPLRYLNPQTGSKRPHKREEWLKDKGVYDLEHYPYVVQTTMNVCVKNRGVDNILFDRDLKMGEDQLFILKNIAAKAAIGFVPEAEYTYVKDGSNSSRVGNNPLFAFDDMMKLYGEYLRIGNEDPRLREYTLQTILYNVDWRLRSDLLFPAFCDGEERERQEGRLSRVMRAIPFQSFCNSPYLSEYHKAFLFKRYGFLGNDAKIEYGEHAAYVASRDGFAWETTLPKVMLSRVLEKGGKLFFSGRLMGPTLLFEGKPSLTLRKGSKVIGLPLGPCSFDYCEAKVKTAKGYGVSFDSALPGKGSEKLEFVLSVPGHESFAVAAESALRRHNAFVSSDRHTLYFRHFKVMLGDRGIVVSRRSLLDSLSAFADRLLSDRAAIAKRAAVKLFKWRNRGKEIWLYADLPSSANEGNALTQFIHDVKQDDEIARYYVTDHGDELTKRHPELEGRILTCESHEHVCCALSAKVVLASYLENFTFRPVSQKTYDGLGDLVDEQELIYLQHGILHAHMPWYFSYDRILFDKIVVSTQFEIENLTKNYCFPGSALIPCGMPRFDELDSSPKRHLKKIAFIPSWRGYLLAGKASERIELDDSFLKSRYFTETAKFIRLVQESGVLREHGYTMELKLHPNFQCYAKLFELEDGVVSLAPSSIDEGDYSIVVTDFSSYVYDFVYVGCQVMYFVPDYVEFKAGLNQYSELDLPFDKGFGPLCISAEEAVEKLVSLVERIDVGGSASVSCKEFFLSHEKDRCENLYRFCRNGRQ